MIVGLAREVPDVREYVGWVEGALGASSPPFPLTQEWQEWAAPALWAPVVGWSEFVFYFVFQINDDGNFLAFLGGYSTTSEIISWKEELYRGSRHMYWVTDTPFIDFLCLNWEGGFCKRKERKGNYWRVNTEIGADMAHSFQSNKVTVLEI